MPNPIAILTADWHLRSTTPLCRTDDYWTVQWKKVGQIIGYAETHNYIPILCAGDLFHTAKSDNRTKGNFLGWMGNKVPFHCIAGNHDLLNHSIEQFEKTALFVVDEGSDYFHFYFYKHTTTPWNLGLLDRFYMQGISYGQDLVLNPDTNILLCHELTDEESCKKLTEKYKAKIIVVGDNHKTFVVEHNGCTIISPGSLMRMTADQIDHKPCFFVLYEDFSIEQVFLDIEPDVISRQHIEAKESRDKRLEAFVESLSSDFEFSSSYERNLDRYCAENKVRKPVQNIIKECVLNENN